MAFEIYAPPGDDEALTEKAKDILNAAAKLGEPLDIEGFLYSWVSGTRVAVERDDSTGEIVGLGIFTAGKRWTHNDITAHVLRIDGKRQGMLEFIVTLCKAIGATRIFVEEPDILEQAETYNRYVVREILVR